MSSERSSSARRQTRGGEPEGTSLVEQLLTRLDPLAVVMLSRERIQETLEDAVERGRMTRSDANTLAAELVRRGRQQTEELFAEIERVLEGGRERLETGRAGLLTEGVTRLARSADRARRTVAGDGGEGAHGDLPIADYDSLTARQVQGRLVGLDAAGLRRVRDHERRHANRKTVLDAVERALN